MTEIHKGDDITVAGTVIEVDYDTNEVLLQTKSGDRVWIAFEDVKTVHPSREVGR